MLRVRQWQLLFIVLFSCYRRELRNIMSAAGAEEQWRLRVGMQKLRRRRAGVVLVIVGIYVTFA
jgi:hypothetical protein